MSENPQAKGSPEGNPPPVAPDRSHQTVPSLDPEIQSLLDKAHAAEERAHALQRAHQEAEARCRRAHAAWLRVAGFRGDAIPRELTGDPYHRRYAELIVELGQLLKEDGWQDRVEAVQADTDPKVYALKMLRKAMEGDVATVTAMVREGINTLFHLGLQADSWLREGLMYEVLNIGRPPAPPWGWEGSYLEAVETADDFIKWIDGEFLVHEMANTGQGNRPSDGRLVRNAFRLVTKLELSGMPLEQTGPFTLNDELVVLRNLRRLCIEQASVGATSAANRGTPPTEAQAPMFEPSDAMRGEPFPSRFIQLPAWMWPKLPPKVTAQIETKEPLTLTLGMLHGMLERGGNLVPATLTRCRELPRLRSQAARLGLCRPGEFTHHTITAIVDLLCVEREMEQRAAYALTIDGAAVFLVGRTNEPARSEPPEEVRSTPAEEGQSGEDQVERRAGELAANDRGRPTTPSRDERLATMEPAVRAAYFAFVYAESRASRRLEDREAYDLLQEEGIPEGAGDRGELTEYRLPTFDTWSRYLRQARGVLNEQKYTRRSGRSVGKSIVSADQLGRQVIDE